MVHPTSRCKKGNTSSSANVASREEDVVSPGKRLRAARERRSKAREDPKCAACSKGRELVRRQSLPPIRHRVTDVTSSSKEAQDYSHIGGMSGIEKSWRYVSPSLPNNAL